jgi:hypothetical protein
LDLLGVGIERKAEQKQDHERERKRRIHRLLTSYLGAQIFRGDREALSKKSQGLDEELPGFALFAREELLCFRLFHRPALLVPINFHFAAQRDVCQQASCG